MDLLQCSFYPLYWLEKKKKLKPSLEFLLEKKKKNVKMKILELLISLLLNLLILLKF